MSISQLVKNNIEKFISMKESNILKNIDLLEKVFVYIPNKIALSSFRKRIREEYKIDTFINRVTGYDLLQVDSIFACYRNRKTNSVRIEKVDIEDISDELIIYYSDINTISLLPNFNTIFIDYDASIDFNNIQDIVEKNVRPYAIQGYKIGMIQYIESKNKLMVTMITDKEYYIKKEL